MFDFNNQCNRSIVYGSFHANSTKIRKSSRVIISDFYENWLKCTSMYMTATCKKVLSSDYYFRYYSHICTGGVLLILYSRCQNWMITCFKMMISFIFLKLAMWKFMIRLIVMWGIQFCYHFVSIRHTEKNKANWKWLSVTFEIFFSIFKFVLPHHFSIYCLKLNFVMKATYMCTSESDFKLIIVIRKFICRCENGTKSKIANMVPLFVTWIGHVGN